MLMIPLQKALLQSACWSQMHETTGSILISSDAYFHVSGELQVKEEDTIWAVFGSCSLLMVYWIFSLVLNTIVCKGLIN